MNLPIGLFGTDKEVANRCQQLIPLYQDFDTWEKALEPETIDAAGTNRGLLLLQRPEAEIQEQAHFHLYLPLGVLARAIYRDVLTGDAEEIIFQAACREPWSLLSLFSPQNLKWLQPHARHRIFLEACHRYWDALDEMGSRYAFGMGQGQRLWFLPTNLKHVLAQYGVPPEKLNAQHGAAKAPMLIQLVLAKLQE